MFKPNKFFKGQRWINSASPELGPGIILEVEEKTISIFYNESGTTIRYAKKTAPLLRSIFLQGETISIENEEDLVVDDIQENSDGTISYICGDLNIPERLILSTLNINHPEDKILNGLTDELKHFHLRIETLAKRANYLASENRGMFGGRMALFAHQLYVVDKICKDFVPRTLLADEVGLGKTIEAGLAIHRLLCRNIVERVVVILPDALLVQWYLELVRKFHLKFSIINQESYIEKGMNPFLENQLVIVGMDFLKGSQLAEKLFLEVSWDLVVMDEAHHLHFENNERSNFEYRLIKDISKISKGLILLTATPEEKGEKQLYSLLNLLDNFRYSSYEKYLKERKDYVKISSRAKELIEVGKKSECELQELVDCYGTGKAYIRNFRSKMEKEFSFFPKRILHPYPLKNKSKSSWLTSVLSQNKNDKFLLICHSKEVLLRLEQIILKEIAGVKVGLFHSGLTLTQRDRQAAYFADPKGAQVLLCTEIGSEGRNFEFCSNLILYDLPKLPGLLEQRIGRLDRIGQKKDVHIHVPYSLFCEEELRFRLFHEGLNAFCLFSSSSTLTYSYFHREFLNFLEQTPSENVFANFLVRIHDKNRTLIKELEEGRDLLLEVNSFDVEKGHLIAKEMRCFEEQNSLKEYMEMVFDSFGVGIDDLNSDSFYVYPTPNMIVPHFPSLEGDGISFTYDRDYALVREDIHFLSWDHSMVIGAMDLIVSEKIGSVTIASRRDGNGKRPFLECFFVWEWIRTDGSDLDQFFPPQVIRILCDFKGENFTEKWTYDFLNSKLCEASYDVKQKVFALPKKRWKELLGPARAHAEIIVNHKISLLAQKALSSFESDLRRILTLEKMSGRSLEIEKSYLTDTIDKINNIDYLNCLNLDSFRVII